MSPSTEPFNEKKYETLMDGHECTEIFFSQLERTNRLDSEFYKKNSLQIMRLLESISTSPITNLVNVSDGNHMSISDKFTGDGIPYYRGQDIHNFFIEDANPIYIDEETFNETYMHRSHLKKGDILLSIVGTIGKVSLVTENNKATCNCKLAILRPYDINKSDLIAIYLKTKYGFNQIDKFKRGAVQMGYLLEDMDQILIPNFSDEFAKMIKDIIEKIKLLTEHANVQYNVAEKYLFDNIGIDMSLICNKKSSSSIKSFSESFGNTGRLDAEYYQPRFEKLINIIQSSDYQKLKNLVTITKSIEPGSTAYRETGIPFIRISDISKYGISKTDKYLECNGKFDNNELYIKKDEILFSKDGSVGIAYKVEEDAAKITSSALLHLIVKDNVEILPDYLTVVLNSQIVQMQAERDAGGSIIKHWKPSEIENVLIPILDIKIQNQISEKVKNSFILRKKSEELLECAKKAVEIAIEKDETEAFLWIKKEIILNDKYISDY